MLILEDLPVRSGKATHHNIYINEDCVIFVPLDKHQSDKFVKTTYLLGGAIGGGIREATGALINNSRRKNNKDRFKDYSLEEIKKIPGAVVTNRNQIAITEIKKGFIILIGEKESLNVFILDKDSATKLSNAIKSLE
jgi:hypothetical protein